MIAAKKSAAASQRCHRSITELS